MRPIVFLHIPKTAGQAIHHELTRCVGKRNVSPIRVHSAVPNGTTNLPQGYLLHSGHIDWLDIDTLPPDRFVFSVLRDPLERIASFYFYILKEAKALSPQELASPQQTGKRISLTQSVDDYFFGGDRGWQRFILDHYDNFYCSYFATQMMRGRHKLLGLPAEEQIAQAAAGARGINAIYHIDNLAALEADALRELGLTIHIAGNYANAGPHKRSERRWPKLVERFERDDSVARIEAFASRDYALMRQLGLPT